MVYLICGILLVWQKSFYGITGDKQFILVETPNLRLTWRLQNRKTGVTLSTISFIRWPRHDSHVTQCSIKRERYEYKMTKGAI